MSICVSCGREKGGYEERCGNCNFKPGSDDDIAKSAYLSNAIHIDELGLPKSGEELRQLGREIASGRPLILDELTRQKILEFLDQYERSLRWLKPLPVQFVVLILGVLALTALAALVAYLGWQVFR